MNPQGFKTHWWGLRDFLEVQKMQHNICSRVLEGGDEEILGGEHPAVITLGQRASQNEVLPTNSLRVERSSRGGLATLHSPGQLVIYPILNLVGRGHGVRSFVGDLLGATQKTLSSYGVPSFCNLNTNPGVYTLHGKIAFCGLKISHGVCTSGISINLSNDLGLFGSLRSCGQARPQLDRLQNHFSLAQEGARELIGSEEVFNRWIDIFKKTLNSSRPKKPRLREGSYALLRLEAQG